MSDPRRWRRPSKSAALPAIMGIINLSPDSFSDGGSVTTPAQAFRRACRLLEQGADILDLGAESTRPGSRPLDPKKELQRLLPAIRRLANLPCPLSVDTYKPEVAALALAAGATMLNDITGGERSEMLALARSHRVPIVLMHMQGTPQTMQQNPRYRDVVGEVRAVLSGMAQRALSAGLSPRQILLDPGIGFGKTAAHNYQLLARLKELRSLGFPLLLGTSRKRFMADTTGQAQPSERDWGTAATVAWAVWQGAAVLRVHAVAEMRMVRNVAWKIAQSAAGKVHGVNSKGRHGVLEDS
jgi:dihydropteroate synthase